jgi:hypothetical protein
MGTVKSLLDDAIRLVAWDWADAVAEPITAQVERRADRLWDSWAKRPGAVARFVRRFGYGAQCRDVRTMLAYM